MTKTLLRRSSAAFALSALLAAPGFAAVVDLSPLPLSAKSQATPNVIFGVDDSGSMDWEVLSPATGGQYYWADGAKGADRGFYTSTGAIRTSGSNDYAYLFPNGYSSADTSDVKKYNDERTYGSVPPTPQFAFTRSAQYNPTYYDPAKNYVPWAPAWIDNKLHVFNDADPEAARSHPYFLTAVKGASIDLTRIVDSQDAGWTFRMRTGMKLDGTPGVRTPPAQGGTWTSQPPDWEAASAIDAAIPYFPATYWVVDSSCNAGPPGCAQGPRSEKLLRIEIKPDSPAIDPNTRRFPSGRTYDQEIRNFANWFQYYRKRKLLLAAAMSSALREIKGIRGGVSYFNQNASSNVTMYDFNQEVDSQNGRAVLGFIYKNRSTSGTPTGTKLDFIGKQFARVGSNAPIQYACQRNAAFILTDGYANGSNPTPPSYDKSVWHGAPPYATVHSRSLGDIAASHYANNPRPDLMSGLLSIDPSDKSPNADLNTDLHMQTFAITLGALGDIYGTDKPQARNPFLNPPSWPTPVNDQPSSIDDLWHATINGRGDMYAAFNAEEVTRAMQEVVRKILVAAGSDAGIAVSTVNLRAGNNTAFVSTYNARTWTGDIEAYPIDLATGDVDTTKDKALWSAAALLDRRAPSSRIIASHNGSSGVPFTAAGLGTELLARLHPSDGAGVLGWLRGDRTGEGTVYRERTSLLGDIVTAEPVYSEGIVYQAANDGMMHAFDADNGIELWAYVPGKVIPALGRLVDPEYSHTFFVDGTPALARIENETRTLLVGGLRGGGAGYYAIDITSPRFGSEAALAAKVLWEFPNATTPTGVRDQIGASFGKPVLVRTAGSGWVVLLTSGYNNTAGQGHLFVLDAVSGQLLRTIDTSGPGLAQISAWVDDPTGTESTVEYVYGGDLNGTVWRFDLRGSTASWRADALVSLGAGKPITSAPELARVGDERGVFFGTGRLLGESDMIDNAIQSVYGIVDRGTTITKPATQLLKQTMTTAPGGIRNISNSSVDWSKYSGWYFDLPAGERVSNDPVVAFGALAFASNKPSPSACATESFLYAVTLESGGQLPIQNFNGQTPWSGRRLGFSYSSRPVAVTLPSGKVIAITHKSDATIASSQLPVGGESSLKRLGWREAFR